MVTAYNPNPGTLPAPPGYTTPAPPANMPTNTGNVSTTNILDTGSAAYAAPTQADINSAPMPVYDVANQPVAPGAAPVSNYGQTDPNTGQPYNYQGGGGSSDWMQFNPEDYAMDDRYLKEMRNIALADPGTSPWLKYQMQQDQIRQQSDMDALQRQGMSNMATQQGDMAMRGGLTSGATERMGQQNLMAQIQGRSDLSRSAAAREAGYRQAAEERQRDVLTQLPGVEQDYSQYHANLKGIEIQQHNEELAAKRMEDAIRAQGGDPSMLQSLMGFGGGLLGNTGINMGAMTQLDLNPFN